MLIKPIGYIKTDFKEKFGIPRQSGRSPKSLGKIIFEPEYQNKDAFRGLEEFSHIWLIFGFSQATRDEYSLTVRPPRLGGNKRVGVFASRSPYRPNSLGLSSVRLIKIQEDKSGITLLVSGVDLLDSTPIYDIKPYLPMTDSHPDSKGGYSDENWEHKLQVDFPPNLLHILPEDKRQPLIECLSDDPRPSYQQDLRYYHMRYADFDVTFKVENEILTVTNIKEDV